MEDPRCVARRRESTAAMAAKIAAELSELRGALDACRGDRLVEPQVSAALLAHLLLCTPELLQNLLIDTAGRPRRLDVSRESGGAGAAEV